jgi:hypothetical protein
MRLPHMTTRRWMVAVAVVAVVMGGGIWLRERRRSFESLAAYHQSKLDRFLIWRSLDDLTVIRLFHRDLKPLTTDEAKIATWHAAMARKYEQAARYPWLPVELDPPEPE